MVGDIPAVAAARVQEVHVVNFSSRSISECALSWHHITYMSVMARCLSWIRVSGAGAPMSMSGVGDCYH